MTEKLVDLVSKWDPHLQFVLLAVLAAAAAGAAAGVWWAVVHTVNTVLYGLTCLFHGHPQDGAEVDEVEALAVKLQAAFAARMDAWKKEFDAAEERRRVVAAYGTGPITVEGVDFKEEMRRMAEEAKFQAELQARLQGEMEQADYARLAPDITLSDKFGRAVHRVHNPPPADDEVDLASPTPLSSAGDMTEVIKLGPPKVRTK